jgi:hypothetical protein
MAGRDRYALKRGSCENDSARLCGPDYTVARNMAQRHTGRQGIILFFDKKMLGKQSIAGWEHPPGWWRSSSNRNRCAAKFSYKLI